MAKQGKKISTKLEKKIVADYAIEGNASEVGRMNNVSHNTVANKLKGKDELLQTLAIKKEQSLDGDIIDYFNSRINEQKKIIDKGIDNTYKHLEQDNMSDSDTWKAIGILLDKALKQRELSNQTKIVDTLKPDNITPILEMLKNKDDR
jgi:hypothetical protein